MKSTLRFITVLLTAAILDSHATAQTKPLEVFLLAGQSNMTGMVKTRTLKHIKMSPASAEEFKDLFDADGKPVLVDDVYVSQWHGKTGGKLAPIYGGGKVSGSMFGPEYAFGVYLHKALNEPFLIIKKRRGRCPRGTCPVKTPATPAASTTACSVPSLATISKACCSITATTTR
jgi:alpha-galactosidase